MNAKPQPIDRKIKYFESRLEIDQEDLSGAIVQQPQIFFEVGQELAFARSKMDMFKLALEREEAELYQRIRRAYEESGEKFTEHKIESSIKLSDTYIQAHTNWLTAKQQVAVLDALRESFVQRSLMLRELARLSLSEGFADPAALDQDVKRAVVRSHRARR